MLDLERFDEVWGTFQPQRVDDLKPGAAAWIGRRLKWQAMWMIDGEDGGPYVGQWAMGLAERFENEPVPPFCWVLLCDLADVSFLENDGPITFTSGVPLRYVAFVGQALSDADARQIADYLREKWKTPSAEDAVLTPGSVTPSNVRPISKGALPCGCSWLAGAGPAYGAECAAVGPLVERVHDESFSLEEHDAAWQAFYDHFRDDISAPATVQANGRLNLLPPAVSDLGTAWQDWEQRIRALACDCSASWAQECAEYRRSKLPGVAGMGSTRPCSCECHRSPAAALNLLPPALTQAELEALKPGPRPQEGMCEECRLTPPHGWRNAEGTVFLCALCHSRKVKK